MQASHPAWDSSLVNRRVAECTPDSSRLGSMRRVAWSVLTGCSTGSQVESSEPQLEGKLSSGNHSLSKRLDLA